MRGHRVLGQIDTTFGQVFTYQIFDTRVVEPQDTTTLRQEANRDLVTLVTCTPLGINTHRILVTGKRILPTPPKDLEAAKKTDATLQFPWWAVVYGGALLLIEIHFSRVKNSTCVGEGGRTSARTKTPC